MPDYIGNIEVPEIAPSSTFPIVPDYGYRLAIRPDVVIHQFGSGKAKIEQRFLMGTGAKRFFVRRAALKESERIALRNFWESKWAVRVRRMDTRRSPPPHPFYWPRRRQGADRPNA